jgi:opine dehydrogenase
MTLGSQELDRRAGFHPSQEEQAIWDITPAFPRFASKQLFRSGPRSRRRRPGVAVAVLGAGNGGLALAGRLSLQGHRVSLWNRSAGPVDAVRQKDGIRLTLPGATPTLARINVATTEMASALRGVDVVLVAVPATGHADVARKAARHLRDGQTILLLPGRTGGALEFQRVLRTAGCSANILLGEANTFPLASRAVAPAEACIFGAKAELLAAALPASRTSELIDNCRAVLPMLSAARSVLHTGLSNLGAIIHPSITLFNADRIEGSDSFDFYAQGVTQEVADVLAAADEERLAIANAHGETVQSLTDWVAAAYGHRADTIREALGSNPAYVGIKAPATLQHRYLLEDVPTGLIPLIALGAVAGIAAPTLRHLENLARRKLVRQCWQCPRTLHALGLEGLTSEEIHAVVQRGHSGRATSTMGYAAVRRESPWGAATASPS